MTEQSPVVPSAGAVPVEVPEDIRKRYLIDAEIALHRAQCTDDPCLGHGLVFHEQAQASFAALAKAYPLVAARVRASTIAELSAVEAVEGDPDVAEIRRWANQTPDRYARDAVLAAADAVERMQRAMVRVRGEERQRMAEALRQRARLELGGGWGGSGGHAAERAWESAIRVAAGSAVPVATPEHDVRCERAYGQDWCFCQRRADVDFSHTATGPVATPGLCQEKHFPHGPACPVATPTEPPQCRRCGFTGDCTDDVCHGPVATTPPLAEQDGQR